MCGFPLPLLAALGKRLNTEDLTRPWVVSLYGNESGTTLSREGSRAGVFSETAALATEATHSDVNAPRQLHGDRQRVGGHLQDIRTIRRDRRALPWERNLWQPTTAEGATMRLTLDGVEVDVFLKSGVGQPFRGQEVAAASAAGPTNRTNVAVTQSWPDNNQPSDANPGGSLKRGGEATLGTQDRAHTIRATSISRAQGTLSTVAIAHRTSWLCQLFVKNNLVRENPAGNVLTALCSSPMTRR